jgi:hypothetical protein
MTSNRLSVKGFTDSTFGALIDYAATGTYKLGLASLKMPSRADLRRTKTIGLLWLP